MEFLSSKDTFPQIAIGLIITVAVFVTFMLVEQIYTAYLSYGKARIPVYPYTVGSSKQIIIPQDPNNPSSITLVQSDNQLTGIEFSYSSFIYISDATESSDGSAGWRSIFYKGYQSGPFPLLGPGVFVSTSPYQGTGSSATAPSTPSVILRIVMNSYDNWYNTLDIKQITLNKWFHLAIVLRNNAVEAYINGNLANKLTLSGTLPYQNYQPLILFPVTKTPTAMTTTVTTAKKNGIPAGDQFKVLGPATGYISNVYYFSYAISYSEIQGMLNMGPSKEFKGDNMDHPPYLIDTWWTQRKG